MIFLGGTALVLALLPTVLFLRNLTAFQPPAREHEKALPAISVLIPARNEARSIGDAVTSALQSEGVEVEVIVLDDHSTDDTAAIVNRLAAVDNRVRLADASELPEGWCGKQYACASLARQATRPLLAFLDADVRLAPDGLARLAGFLESRGIDLVSGFPRQETGGVVEAMVIPLMHFILLGFLPIRRMRTHPDVGLAAGCGQLFLTKKSAYEQMGGHATIRATLHDGLKLPRAYRAAGLKTDLCDATDLARCRMYRNVADLWSGLAKNATEALAAPTLILPATLLLFGGQVLPFVLLIMAESGSQRTLMSLGVAFAYLPRVWSAVRFRQSMLGALLHPIGVLIFLAIQWYAFGRSLVGRPATWKGRAYPARVG